MSQIASENERAFRSDEQIRDGLQRIWETMQDCVRAGNSKRRHPAGRTGYRATCAGECYRVLQSRAEDESERSNVGVWTGSISTRWPSTKRTQRVAGSSQRRPTEPQESFPPCCIYFDRFCKASNQEKIEQFFLTAALIGSLYKRNASISGAEVGCQGEVGVACSMAAGALTEVRGGTPNQVEEAAEIGMEHNLGLTCDPIKGLVQIPCIERNAMGAVKAINASRLALRGDGKHFVSLDRVIRVMKRTGADMS